MGQLTVLSKTNYYLLYAQVVARKFKEIKGVST